MKVLDRKYDDTVCATIWAYDLEDETYLGARFLMTPLNLRGLSGEEVIKRLYAYSGKIESFETSEELFNRLHKKLNKLNSRALW